jgi:hypothetical protein
MPDMNLDPAEPERPVRAFNWAAYKRYRPLVIRIIDHLGGEVSQPEAQLEVLAVDEADEQSGA